MLKLKKIITQLKEEDFNTIRDTLVKNKAENFLFLLKEYRAGKMSDPQIMQEIKTNASAFYALKSRLYDRIQHSLIGNKKEVGNETFNLLSDIPQFCYQTPRETSIAMLHKLETDLIHQDKPAELVLVYSALKKVHLHSQKYYHYSQLYNKHIAYTLALEKAEDLLGNFNKTLAGWFFSRSEQDRELLLRYYKEIKNVLALNGAHHIEVIHNIVIIELFLFCDIEIPEEEPIDDLIEKTLEIIGKFPGDSQYKHFLPVTEFLKFEYYKKLGQVKKALPLYDKLKEELESWLLRSNNCLAFKLLLSKLELPDAAETEETPVEFLYDQEDLFSAVVVRLHNAVIKLRSKKYKESAALLNDALNFASLKDCFHIEIEIKLTLAYVYLLLQDYDMATNLIRSIYRKIKSTEDSPYQNALEFSKALTQIISNDESLPSRQKIIAALKMFTLNNSGQHRILGFLENEITGLKTKYA
ncbi:MAG: hypothetical protein IAF38_13585 [Bacteroidia bacterium]|nr:hypothetical protein [Bacteroidia bacterium]